jgi:hypothetical protein
LPENVLDAVTSDSEDPTATPLSRVYGKGKQIGAWSWLEEPGNEWRLKRVGTAMTSVSSFIPLTYVISGSSSNAGRIVITKLTNHSTLPKLMTGNLLRKVTLS